MANWNQILIMASSWRYFN